MGCVPFTTIASNLLAFSSKMADVAATSTDESSVTLLSIFTEYGNVTIHIARSKILVILQQLLSTTCTTTHRQQHQTTC